MSASIVFGFNGNLSRLLFNDGISPVTLVEFRMIIGGACLFIVLVGWRRHELKLPRRAIFWIIAFGLSLALVTYIAYLLLGRRVGRDLPPLTSTTYGAIVAGIFWLIVQPRGIFRGTRSLVITFYSSWSWVL
jgi:drug/metabolite transporter (DMT)-like permease